MKTHRQNDWSVTNQIEYTGFRQDSYLKFICRLPPVDAPSDLFKMPYLHEQHKDIVLPDKIDVSDSVCNIRPFPKRKGTIILSKTSLRKKKAKFGTAKTLPSMAA